jgi:hypothetical protein
VIPRWGLVDRVEQSSEVAEAATRTGPSPGAVRNGLFISVLVLGVAALVYVVRYVLLLVNRHTLLDSWVALTADWLGVLVSVGAIAALIASGVLLIQWLIARRAAVFAHHGLSDQRSARALWAGCAAPLANLLWAPVFVIELATMEQLYSRLRIPIIQWWIAWLFSYATSIVAMITSFATDPQGIANNTVIMVVAYLLAALTLTAVARVFEAFVRKPVARPAHRWVVVGADAPDRPAAPASAGPVELEGAEPAA